MNAELERQSQMEQQYRMLPAFLQEHSQMVGEFSWHLTEYVLKTQGADFFSEMDQPLLDTVYLMGRYHDVGKAAITGTIWQNSGMLDQHEKVLMRTHPVLGAYIVRGMVVLPEQEPRIDDFWEAVAQCCAYHHERWDGSGYPFGIAGEQIPCFARIVSIADAYDAMTAARPYHKGISKDAALQRIDRGAGTQFDPVLAGLFCQLMQNKPADSVENRYGSAGDRTTKEMGETGCAGLKTCR